jgi:hypothetical protein
LIWGVERFSPGANIQTRTDCASDRPVLPQSLHPRLHSPGKESIVCIEKNQKVSPTFNDPSVPGSRCALICLMTVANLRVPLRDLAGVIRGTVIDHEGLDSAVALPENALHCLTQKVGMVVTGNNNRDERFRDQILRLRLGHQLDPAARSPALFIARS